MYVGIEILPKGDDVVEPGGVLDWLGHHRRGHTSTTSGCSLGHVGLGKAWRPCALMISNMLAEKRVQLATYPTLSHTEDCITTSMQVVRKWSTTMHALTLPPSSTVVVLQIQCLGIGSIWESVAPDRP